MELLNRLLNSSIFWAGWVIIPVLMEIIPSIGSVLVLVKKRLFPHRNKELAMYPEISLIIPVYNSRNTLRQCIESIAKSNYPNHAIRIFLVNNQGTDDSFQIFCECQKEHPDLLMQWLNAKQGKSKALNLALFNSEGKYIIHLDSDGILEKDALANMVAMFESNDDVECVTGAIMIEPRLVEEYKWFLPKLFRKLEFLEYAQAFLAGRNYASEMNAIYTLSGAFSAFRKSVVLKSQLYNTDTICEDTQITFQMKLLQNKKVAICEDAIFFVDPIENMNKLYTQRQRWQRGSLEVSHLFLKGRMKVRHMFSDVNVRTLVYDHTFAFPRMIWYLALFCLMGMNYSYRMILISLVILFALYTVVGYFYFFSTIGFLKKFPEVRRYYAAQWYVVPLLPFFNLLVFFIRFAGVINSINTNSAWRTRNLSQERDAFLAVIKQDFAWLIAIFVKLKSFVNVE